MSNSPLENGFKSKQQEDFFKKDNPGLWRLVIRKFGSYGSAKHLKALRDSAKTNASRRSR